MIHELRMYSVVPGRLEDNLDRFEHHLPKLMARHGIWNVGRWVAVAGPRAPMFVYVMAYADLDQRERQWNGFYADDEWWELRARTNAGSQMVDRFDLSFLKANPAWTPPDNTQPDARRDGLHELALIDVALGHGPDANAFLRDTYLPLVVREAGQVMMLSDFMTGPSLPRLALMTAWSNAEARRRARRAIDGDPELRGVQRSERERIGQTSLGRTDIYELEPTAFDLPLATLGRVG